MVQATRHTHPGMSTQRIKAPAARPCGSCPYRCDVPSGVWDASEYDKLPAYDRDTFAQPTVPFLCHQVNGSVCSGWAAVHDMDQSLALRIAAVNGSIDPDTLRAVHEYRTDVPLFASGEQAAAHGRAEIDEPGDKARRTIQKIVRTRGVTARRPAGG